MFDGITSKFKVARHKIAGGKVEYPTKTTINLASVEVESALSTPVTVGLFAVCMVAILLFAKFGVVDLLTASSKASGELSSAQSTLTELQSANSTYAKLKEQLESYSAPGMTNDEKTYANREHALLVASSVSNLGSQLVSVSLSGNTMLIQIEDSNLDTVSKTVQKLNNLKWVESATPNTAQTNEDSNKVTSTITVQLTPATGSGSTSSSEE